MYSTHNKGKSVVAEKFIRTVKNKIYKYMTSISENVYIDKSNDIVHEYNKTYHSIIKMKLVDIKSSTYIGFNVEENDEDLKFGVGDYVRLWKYKKIFTKDYTPNWSLKKFLLLKKLKIPWAYVICDLNGKEIIWMFYKKEL